MCSQPPDISVPFKEIIFRDIRIKGSLVASKNEAADMLRTVAEYGIWVNKNIFHGLNEIPNLLDLVHSGKMAGKGVIVVDEEAVTHKNPK